MNDDLFEKLQNDLNAQIEAHYEKQRIGPISIRTGPAATLQDVAERTAIAALQRLGNSRWYALDADEKLKFGAYAVAARQEKAILVDVLSQMSATEYPVNLETNKWATPNWTQMWRPTPVILEPLGTDPVTGQQVRNPWLEPHDFKSQNVIKGRSPRQARWLSDVAKNNGVTAAMVDELEFERLQAEQLGKVPFSQKEWSAGAPMRGENLTARMQFERSIEDPWKLSAHRHEREMGSPRALFGNLSFRMALAKKDQKLAEIHKAAEKIYAQWQAEAQEKAA